MPSTLTTRRSVILPGGAPEPAPVHPLDQVNTYTLAILNRHYPFLIHAYLPPWHGHNGILTANIIAQRARAIQMNNQLARTVKGPSSPNALESSKTPEVRKIINLLQKSSSVENGLRKAWDEENPKDSASTFVELFLYLDNLAEKTSEVVYHTTAIANQHEIWKLLDYSKEDFMELIQKEERIKPLSARSTIKAAITTRINSGNKTRKYKYAINKDLVSIIKEEKIKKQQV
ncbi:hypothetical protein DFH27DRAFT_614618 [Peziza echinospora]|nr:hypothetical protein DFH27DRAFT_614618 [Peziza echinospora]